MSSPRATERIARRLGLALAGAALLAGCSDIYYDRRESINFGSGDAVAGNRAIHMIDPWPAHSANRNLAFNGEKMQTAVERYRLNKVIPPIGAGTSSMQAIQAQQAQQTGQGQSVAPAAPVK